VCGAAVIVWKVAVVDAPPGGSAFIVSDQASSTITPFAHAPTTADAGASSSDPAVVAGTGNSGGSADSPSAGTPAVDVGNPAQPQDSASDAEASPTVPTISVYVSGDVARPGVYSVPEGSRVVSAVTAAGGANPDADLEQINLAQKLSDGDHITVYRKGEVAPTPTASNPSVTAGTSETNPSGATTPTAGAPAPTQTTGSSSGQSGAAKPTPGVKINLNTATAADLEQLPGIGPSLAQRIIADRTQNGPFKSLDDLARISGIKAGIIARIRDYVTVGP